MPYTKKKYTKEQNSEWRYRALDVLNNSENALTLDEIKERDIILAPITTQKLARLIGELVEMNLVRKCQSREKKRMVYKSVSVMFAQGYDVTGEPDEAETEEDE